jgi:hypothetical protein
MFCKGGDMKRIIVPVFVLSNLLTGAGLSNGEQSNALSVLLNSTDVTVQREALRLISKNKGTYVREMIARIERCYKSGEYSNELDTLLHVAALVKSELSLPILERLWLDNEFSEEDCIYCCPRALVMAVFAIHKMWKPPALSAEQREQIPITNTLGYLENLTGIWAKSDLKNPYIGDKDKYGEAADKLHLLSEEGLLAIVTDPKATYEMRYVASIELRSRFRDDRLLLDYYWWALNACDDTAGECYCFATEMILRAEYFSASKMDKKDNN